MVHRLVAQLSRHVLWDSLSLFVPPAASLIYVIAMLFQAAWLSQTAAVLAATLTLVLGAYAVLLRRRPLMPTVRGAARLVDQKSGAKDHFLTLATIDPATQPSSFLMRLRSQAENFLHRVELKRDFPYRLKRSSYWSLGASLIAAILMHLLTPPVQSARSWATAQERLRNLAQQMGAKPDLRALAKELEALASKLDDPKNSPNETQVLAQKIEQKIDERQKKEEQEDNRDLLGQAASALDGLEQQQAATGKEQQQAASGKEQQQDQQKGGGGIQSNAPQDGQGENKQTQGASGESTGESNAQLGQKKTDQGKSAQTNSKEQDQAKNQAGESKDNQQERNQPGKDPNKEKAGKTERGSKDGAGKQQSSAEPPPQGGPQADRFYKPGEGKEGFAAKGYVTVQLPEDIVADAKGESRTTKDSKSNRTRTPIPVSNVPLPAHIPNAPAEKQQMPIEYRGIIR